MVDANLNDLDPASRASLFRQLARQIVDNLNWRAVVCGLDIFAFRMSLMADRHTVSLNLRDSTGRTRVGLEKSPSEDRCTLTMWDQQGNRRVLVNRSRTEQGLIILGQEERWVTCLEVLETGPCLSFPGEAGDWNMLSIGAGDCVKLSEENRQAQIRLGAQVDDSEEGYELSMHIGNRQDKSHLHLIAGQDRLSAVAPGKRIEWQLDSTSSGFDINLWHTDDSRELGSLTLRGNPAAQAFPVRAGLNINAWHPNGESCAEISLLKGGFALILWKDVAKVRAHLLALGEPSAAPADEREVLTGLQLTVNGLRLIVFDTAGKERAILDLDDAGSTLVCREPGGDSAAQSQ